MNCTVVPAGKLTVPLQSGFELVYADALRATALPVFQFPIAAVLPTILMVWPYWVVTRRLNVTATEVAVAHPVVVVVDVAEVLEVEMPL